MTTDLARKEDAAQMLERVVVGGDLSKLSPTERLAYYRDVCESVGLNPLTRPFDYLTLNGRMVLYAKRDATDQLRSIHKVSVHKMEKERFDDLFVVTAYARDKEGREDSSTGAVSIANLKGEALANAIMKAETKAKRRVTLSLCGLGLLDETEVASVPDAIPGRVDLETGEVLNGAPTPEPPSDILRGHSVIGNTDKDILIGRIEAGFDKLAMKGNERLTFIEKACHVLRLEDAEMGDLQTLLTALTNVYIEQNKKAKK